MTPLSPLIANIGGLVTLHIGNYYWDYYFFAYASLFISSPIAPLAIPGALISILLTPLMILPEILGTLVGLITTTILLLPYIMTG